MEPCETELIQYRRGYRFDQSWLAGGVDLTAGASGLFAISPAFWLMANKDIKPMVAALKGGSCQGFGELFRHEWVAAISSADRVLIEC